MYKFFLFFKFQLCYTIAIFYKGDSMRLRWHIYFPKTNLPAVIPLSLKNRCHF